MIKSDTVSTLNPWRLLRYGDPKQGLAFLLDVWKWNSTPSHIMELGVAYLWTGDFEAASKHFDETIRKFPGSISSFYGMAGVAKWCLGDFSAAVGAWTAGLNVRYADAGGRGVQIPLLLLVASVLEPVFFQREKAEEILLRKIEDVRADSWPGSLLRFVLGQESAESATGAVPPTKLFAQKHHEWLIEFYREILGFRRGDLTITQFREALNAATDTSQPEFADEDYFLSLMWSEEFFIARHAAQSARSA
jgi:hypothetical protein